MIVEFAPEQLEQLAELVAARLGTTPAVSSTLVDVQAIAERYGVNVDWVYRHADELGVRRLGGGPRALLRFDLAEVDELLRACPGGRSSEPVKPAQRRRSWRTRDEADVHLPDLVPIRSLIRADSGRRKDAA